MIYDIAAAGVTVLKKKALLLSFTRSGGGVRTA